MRKFLALALVMVLALVSVVPAMAAEPQPAITEVSPRIIVSPESILTITGNYFGQSPGYVRTRVVFPGGYVQEKFLAYVSNPWWCSWSDTQIVVVTTEILTYPGWWSARTTVEVVVETSLGLRTMPYRIRLWPDLIPRDEE